MKECTYNLKTDTVILSDGRSYSYRDAVNNTNKTLMDKEFLEEVANLRKRFVPLMRV
jgi:hypothetical protein